MKPKSKLIPVRVGRKVVGHVWRSNSTGFPYGCEHSGSGMSWECTSKADAVETVVTHESRKN